MIAAEVFVENEGLKVKFLLQDYNKNPVFLSFCQTRIKKVRPHKVNSAV